ncbi:hypothetical protein BSNK01_07340 [Bacillaceae bacterium]
MKIRKIDIFGFGHFHDFSSEDLTANLIVFTGRNEAGKSTLLAFLRSLLFGFPSRHHFAERYEPLGGGRYGGALTVEDENGERFRIERVEGKSSSGEVTVYREDGSIAGENLIRQLLGGVSAQLFRQIFAFSLSELQRLETLQDAEIGGYIYSAGMGTGGVSLVEAEKRLEQMLAEKFKPNAQKPIINQLLRELEQLGGDLRRLKEESAEYNRLQEETERLGRESEKLKEALQTLRAEADWLNVLARARPEWEQLMVARKELSALPCVEQFPEDGVQRLVLLEKEKRGLTAELTDLRQKQQALQTRLRSHARNEKLLQHKEEIEQLAAKARLYAERSQRIVEYSADRENKRLELDRLYQELGEDWNDAKADRFPVSVADKETVRKFRSALLREEQELVQADRERQRAALLWEKSKRETDQWQAAWQEAAAAQGELQGMTYAEGAERLSRIKHWHQKIKEGKQTEKYLQEQIARNRERMKRFAEREAASLPRGGRRYAPIAGGVLAFAVLLPLLLLLSEHAFVPSFAFSLFAALAVTWLMFEGRRKAVRSQAVVQATVSELAQECEEWETALAQWHEKLAGWSAELQRELRPFSDALGGIAARFGEPDEGEKALRRLEQVLEECRWLEEEGKRKRERHEEWQRRLAQAESDRQEAERVYRERQTAYRQTLAEWRSWLEGRGFPSDLTPDGVLEAYRHIEQARLLLEQCRQLERKMARFEQENAAFRAECERLALQCAVPLTGSDPCEYAHLLKRRLEDELALLAEAKQWETALRETEAQLGRIEQKLAVLDREYRELIASGQAADAEDFRRKANVYERRKALRQIVAQREATLEVLAGSKDRKEKLAEALAANDETVLAAKRAALAEKIKAFEREFEQNQERRGELRKRISDLEKSGLLSEKRHAYEEKKAAFSREAKEWAKIALCRFLLQKARQVYEQERQPVVVRRASRYFSQMTGGRYRRVFAPLGEKKLLVERDDGVRLETEYLSRGTAEQLYLAMRFALANEYAQRHPLPLIMDDIFVNFDDTRLRAALRVLAELVDTHQVLLFTCHHHVLRAIEEEIAAEKQWIAIESYRG